MLDLLTFIYTSVSERCSLDSNAPLLYDDPYRADFMTGDKKVKQFHSVISSKFIYLNDMYNMYCVRNHYNIVLIICYSFQGDPASKQP